MSFNNANVDNRLRQSVRGRVIVATTSKIVELLNNKLTDSYPLYSVDSIPDGFLLVFCVEVDGFLTFDKDCEVRILAETTSFEKLHYDPKAFALVRAADAFKPFVTSAYVLRNDSIYKGNPGYASMMSVTVHYSVGASEDVQISIDDSFDFEQYPPGLFPENSRWPGLAHLPKGMSAPLASSNIS